MTQKNQPSASTRKISNYITMIVVVVIALAAVSIILAASLYYTGTTATGSTQAGDYSSRIPSSHRRNRSFNVYVHVFPVKKASSRNEN